MFHVEELHRVETYKDVEICLRNPINVNADELFDEMPV